MEEMMTLNEATLAFIRQHRTEDVRQLALRGCRQAEVDVREALVQIAGWQQARTKLPDWAATEGVLYPPHLSMEQCSSQLTATYKQTIIQRTRQLEDSQPLAGVVVSQSTFADLTGGLGIDCSYLSHCFAKTTYVERQELLCQLAKHNFPLFGMKHFTICHQDGVEYLQQMEAVDWIYLDPARRNAHGGKVVAISDCEPDVQVLEPLLLAKAPHVLVKLSPMLDLTWSLRDLHHVEAAYIIAADGECKELLLQLSRGQVPPADEIPITCTHLHSNSPTEEFTFTKREEQQAPLRVADEPQNYLYEPHAALLKAGAYNLLSQRYPVKKLHPNSHLYTSEVAIEDFPGRRFRIIGWSGMGKKELKALTTDLKSANLTVRNFPISTEALRKKLKLTEGGPITLYATTKRDGEHILIKGERSC